MELAYSQVEALLTVRHDIAMEHRPAFRGRLQHFQRLGFPTNVNPGKGRRATYGWRQIIELAICIDLLEIGLSPDAAVKIIQAATVSIFDAVQTLPEAVGGSNSFAGCVADGKFPPETTSFLRAYPFALTRLKSGDGETPIVEIVSLEQLSNELRYISSLLPTSIMIDLGGLVVFVCHLLADLLKLSSDDVSEDYTRWCQT